MVYIVVLCLFVCNMQAAYDGWCGADMKVVYHSRLSSPWEASFKGAEIPFEGTTLYQAASKHILQGYYFLPTIDEDARYDPELRKSGVREFICAKQSFISATLERCLEAVVGALGEKKDRPACRHIRRHHLTEEVAKRALCPKGKTRKWSVIAKDKVTNPSFANRVYFVFRGAVDALSGELCSAEISLEEQRSLLYFEEAGGDYSPPYPTTPLESVPSPEDLLKPSCGSKYNVGVIYFAEENKPSAALMNVSSLTSSIRYVHDGTVKVDTQQDAFTVLKTGMLEGFLLKAKSRATKDIAVLGKPHVRKCACKLDKFECVFLDGIFHYLPQFLKEASITLQNDDFWCGLKEEHCEMIPPKFKQMKWSIISSEDVREQLNGGTCKKGTVLLLLQGETVALKGRPTAGNLVHLSTNSLFENLSKQKIKQLRKDKKGQGSSA